jgi:iron complex outermembrane receptor protein
MKMGQAVFCWLMVLLALPLRGQDHLIPEMLAMPLEELLQTPVTVGNRLQTNIAEKLSVPVEVISGETLRSTGYPDLPSALAMLLPQMNLPTPSLSDLTDHQPPFSLNGMGPDQLLVLVDGKRKISGSILHYNRSIGRGSVSLDLRNIPLLAVERVELLGDGAAAQYGSDAIGGILNIVTRQHPFVSEVILQGGQAAQGDGEAWSVQGAIHDLFGRQETDFFFQVGRTHAYDRSGFDVRPYDWPGSPTPSQPMDTFVVGPPEAAHGSLYFRWLRESDAQGSWYVHLNASQRDSSAGAFYRRPQENRNVRSLYPEGFLPRIAPTIHDAEMALGNKRVWGQSHWEFGIKGSVNQWDLELKESVNASYGLDSPTHFQLGTLRTTQVLVHLDAHRPLPKLLGCDVQLAWGGEWRQEGYRILSGEEASYAHGGIGVLDGPNAGDPAPAGAQGFPGFQPKNEVDAHRQNGSAYLEIDVKDPSGRQFQLALRAEHYSDFGDTVNGKLSGSLPLCQGVRLRASVSSGFRAPSIQQHYYNATATVFSNGIPQEVGTFGVDHPLARALGSQPLSAEQSLHANLGFYGWLTPHVYWSVDASWCSVSDRIVPTGDIYPDEEIFGPEIVRLLEENQVSGIRFLTNALDTTTQALNAVLKYEQSVATQGKISLALRWHANRNEIQDGPEFPGLVAPYESILFPHGQHLYYEEGQPRQGFTLVGSWQSERLRFQSLLRRFGSFSYTFESDDPAFDQRYASLWQWDVSFEFKGNQAWRFLLGFHNLLDAYPEQTNAGFGYVFDAQIIPYHQNSPMSAKGSAFLVQGAYRF